MLKKAIKHLYLALVFLFIVSCLHAQTTDTTVDEKLNLKYTSVDNWDGKLDFYRPKGSQKIPLVIYIHGGGWTHGKKEAEFEKFKVFLANGYAVANVEYRLADQAPAPAAIVDVNAAIQYLLKQSIILNIDPKRIVLMGGSAGAHLALLAGLRARKPVYSSKPFKVAAIISKYGPTDLLTWDAATSPSSASSTWLGNRKTDTAFIKSLSPINYVVRNNIPILFIHGDEDRTVPLQQSTALYDKLKKYGSITTLYVIKGGKHGNFGDVETAKMDLQMLSFLDKYLGKR